MRKKISLLKIVNKLLLSVNTQIKSFFNSINVLVNSKKKPKKNLINIDKKILISCGSVVIIVFNYFLIPTFYDKNLIKIKLTNQILEKYNLKVNFKGVIKYGLFPKPHYFIKDTAINYDEKNLGKANITKIYISIKNFFSLDNLKIKDLNFKQTEFDINSNNFIFFEKVLNANKSDFNINFFDSKLFYKDKFEDVIFLTKIKDLNFLYTDDFKQQLNIELNIFNIPFKMNVLNDLEKKNTIIELESHKLRLKIKNNFDLMKKT